MVEVYSESISIIIPAFNEEEKINNTLTSLLDSGQWMKEIIVVDDGSTDQTSSMVQKWKSKPVKLIKLKSNRGKAVALQQGVAAARGDILLFVDADLENSAAEVKKLVQPIQKNEADMTVAIFPHSIHGGFGLVKRFTRWAIYKRTGNKLQEPLCGQRALRRKVFQACYQGDKGFGIEVGITLDLLEKKHSIKEIEIPLTHRDMGKNMTGFYHRMKQGLYVCHAFLSRR